MNDISFDKVSYYTIYILLCWLLQKSVLPICSECLGTAAKNCSGAEEALSSCRGCGTNVHLSCVPGLNGVLGPEAAWFCEDCRLCAGCSQAKEQVSSYIRLFCIHINIISPLMKIKYEFIVFTMYLN